MRLYSKSGADYSNNLPGMRKAFAELPTNAAILDGELCLIDPGGGATFYRLMTQMRTRTPDEAQLILALVANAAPVEALKADPAPPKCYLKRPTRPTPTPRPLRTPTPPR